MRNSILLVLLAIFVSCGGNELKIVNTNLPENGEISIRQNIEIEFNKELANDSLFLNSDSIDYFRFTPDLPGTYSWLDNKTLSFSPYEGFAPNTKYKMEITEKILSHSKEKIDLPEKRVFEFHTPPLKLIHASAKWVMPDSTNGMPALLVNLQFNHKINQADLDSLMEITINGQEHYFSTQDPGIGKTANVLLREDNYSAITDKPMVIKIEKGMEIINANDKMAEDIIYETSVPGIHKLEITGLQTSKDISELTVQLFTNQSISRNQKLKNFIKIKPSVKIEFEQNEFGLLLKGGFNPETVYEIKVSKTLKGVFGKELGEDYHGFAAFNDVQPLVEFTEAKAMYLSSKSTKNVGIRIYGVKEFEVQVVKIFENNILGFSRRGKSWGYSYDEEDNWNEFRYYRTGNFGDEIYKEKFLAKDLPTKSGISLLKLDFEDIIKKYKGIYVVKVKSTDSEWLQDSKIISISDVGLIVKRVEDQILVFANSIKTAEPLGGCDIKIFSTTNQMYASQKTNSDGIAIFQDFNNTGVEFEPGMISGDYNGDVNYLLLDYKSEVDKTRFEGTDGIDGKGYKTFIYSSRNLYRPDDTLVIAGIIRDEDWGTVKDMPVKAELLLPNSKVYKEMKLNLNAQGGFETQVYLPRTLVTGIYNIRVSLMNGTVLKSYPVSIEDFVPDRIKVEMESDKKEYIAPDKIMISARVNNLFGPPAANRKYEMNFSFRKSDFRPKGFRKYSFAIHSGSDRLLDNQFTTGKTDEKGLVEENAYIDSALSGMGLIKCNANLTVFDETNRTVDRSLALNIYTQDAFNGIGDFDYWVETRKKIKIPVVAVDKNGKALNNHKATVKIYKYDWETVLRRNHNGSYYFESQKIEKLVMDRKLKISGKNYFFAYSPQFSGRYQVRIYNEGSNNYVSRNFYSYSWGTTSNKSFAVDPEGKIDITCDKEKYNIGDKAKILFKTPFRGKLLVTVERDKILDHFIIETDKNAASLTLDIKEEHLPNIFISATLIKPLASDAVPLTIAYGYLPVIVEKKSNIIPVEIIANEKVRSKSKQKIKIKTLPKKDIHLTVAVVDEGILQVKNFQTPDPYKFFYQKIAMGVNSYSLYPYLFPELKAGKYRYGAGDAFGNLEKRLNPLTKKRVNLVSFWSGLLKTNSKGEASYEIDIPEFSGSLRVMACAYIDKAFGSAEMNMTVADPLVLSTALPRFLSPSDEFDMPVTITNTTAKTAKVDVDLSLKGAVQNMGSDESGISIPPNSEKQIVYKMKARNQIGDAQVKVIAKAFGEKFTSTTDLTVRPPASLQKITKSGKLDAGKNIVIETNDKFFEESIDSRVIVARTPLIQFTKDVEYLIGYPYGCIEQTVSKAFPQLAMKDLLKVINSGNSGYLAEEADRNVQLAIDKVQSMQQYSGAMSFWQGGYNTSWWGTAYAVHFLIECRKAGYSVNPGIIDKGLKYLSERASKGEKRLYYYWEDGKYAYKEKFKKENVYSLFVLALAGRPNVSLMNFYRSKSSELTADSKSLLAAGFALSGDKRNISELTSGVNMKKSKNETGGSFSSPTRDLAITLYTLSIADPKNKKIFEMARNLTNTLKHTRYLSTQDRSFGLLALAAISRASDAKKAKAKIFIDNKEAAELNTSKPFISENYKDGKLKISNNGGSPVYYFSETEGITKDGSYTEEDSYLKVRRTFYTRDGKEISNNKFRQGDLVVVKITLSTTYDEYIKNIVVTDILPAGLEIENPRLNKGRDFEWIKKQSYPEHFDYRDDRINIFCTIGDSGDYSSNNSKEKNFYYMVRAVTNGSFTMGPVSADAMYDGVYHSYHGGGTVVVEP